MRTLPTLCLATLLPAALGAQPPDRDSVSRDTTRLPTVPVIGSILAGPLVGSAVPARATTIDRARVRRAGARSLAQAVSDAPGFSLYDDLGSPYKLTVQSRGFTTSPVVGLPQGLSVFLDGVPVNEPDAAGVNFDLLPLSQVERVELLSGTSTLLGPNSLGGAINLVTRRDGAPDGEVEASAGAFGRASLEAARSGEAAGWRYHAAGALERDDGWRQATGARLGNVLLNLGRRGERRGMSLQLMAAGSRAETAGSLPESVYEARPDSNLSANDFERLRQLHVAASGYAAAGAGRATGGVWLRQHDAERFNVNQADDPDVRSFARSFTGGASVDWTVVRPAFGGTLGWRAGASGSASDVGVRIRADLGKFGRADSLTTSVTSTVARGALFTSADMKLGRVTLSAAARADMVRLPFRNRLRPARDTVNHFARVSPRGGVSFDAGGGASFYASLGQSFRTPAIIELACADPKEPCPLPFALGDDPPLAPVVATTAEAGGRWARGGARLETSVFVTRVRDDIFLHPYEEEDEPAGSTIDGFFANVARTRRAGIEVSGTVNPHRRLALNASYAHTSATFESPADIFSIREEAGGENEVEPGDRLPLVPAHVWRLAVDVSLPRGAEFTATSRYTGRQWMRGDEANETEPLAAYTVVDLAASVPLGPVRLVAGVENLLGSRYATFGTFNVNQGNDDRLERFLTPGAPRTVRLSLRVGGTGAAW